MIHNMVLEWYTGKEDGDAFAFDSKSDEDE